MGRRSKVIEQLPRWRHNFSRDTGGAAAVGRYRMKALEIARAFLLVAVILLAPSLLAGQEWSWKIEEVDKSGSFSSIAADGQSNLHLSYISGDSGVKYGFRSAESGKWYTSSVGRASEGFTNIALDHGGNPGICYTAYESLNVLRYHAGAWKSQEVGSGFGLISFSCSLAFAADDTPHVSWYQYYDRERALFLHLKHAVLKDDQWLARTVDFDGETGKWNSLVVDSEGRPHISYSAWRSGQLKYAVWDGKQWQISVVDSRERYSDTRGEGNPGIANSLALASGGAPSISYFDGPNLKFAFLAGNAWKVETVDALASVVGSGWTTSRSSLLLDADSNPHIIYGDYLGLKHAFRKNGRWQIGYVDRGGPGLYKYAAAAIDRQGMLYVCYQDPSDGSLKVAIGHPSQGASTSQAAPQP